MKKQTIIEANEFDVCSLCGRNHRKLVIYKGYKLGLTCKGHVEYFFRFGDADNGRILNNLKAMTGLTKNDILKRHGVTA